jgi:hypothetical protein
VALVQMLVGLLKGIMEFRLAALVIKMASYGTEQRVHIVKTLLNVIMATVVSGPQTL